MPLSHRLLKRRRRNDNPIHYRIPYSATDHAANLAAYCNVHQMRGGDEKFGRFCGPKNMKCASPLPLSIPPPKTAFWSPPRQRGWGTCKNMTKLNIPDPVKGVFFTNRVMRIPPPTFYPPSQNAISGILAQRSRIFPKCASPLPILSPPPHFVHVTVSNRGPGGVSSERGWGVWRVQ